MKTNMAIPIILYTTFMDSVIQYKIYANVYGNRISKVEGNDEYIISEIRT